MLAHLRHAGAFAHLATVLLVRLERRSGPDIPVEGRYYSASCRLSAAQLLRHKRSDWRRENSLHWVLDLAFREDESRLRKDRGAQNLAPQSVRHSARNPLQQETTCKQGALNKRLKAAGDTDCLLTVRATLFQQDAIAREIWLGRT